MYVTRKSTIPCLRLGRKMVRRQKKKKKKGGRLRPAPMPVKRSTRGAVEKRINLMYLEGWGNPSQRAENKKLPNTGRGKKSANSIVEFERGREMDLLKKEEKAALRIHYH